MSVTQETSSQILDELLPETWMASERTAAPIPDRPRLLDAGAFDRIQREYKDRLVDSLAGFVKDRDKAEDLAAKAFQSAWENREKFRGESLPSTWIQAIARNQARQSLSRDRSAQFDSIDRVEARELAAPELVTDELERQDDRLRLQNALARLPDEHRRALTAHFVEGLSTREIARREGVPQGTVLSRIFTAKQLLRRAWEAPLSVARADGTTSVISRRPPARIGSQAPAPGGNGPPEPPDPTWNR